MRHLVWLPLRLLTFNLQGKSSQDTEVMLPHCERDTPETFRLLPPVGSKGEAVALGAPRWLVAREWR